MRVIAGEARGRSLEALPGTDVTRPTLSQVKEAMFSIVQFDLPGARVLDLYAGSGQLGIEALSRGAARCVFLDENREAVNIIMRNCKACGVFDRSRVNIGEAARYLSACREQFEHRTAGPALPQWYAGKDPAGGGQMHRTRRHRAVRERDGHRAAGRGRRPDSAQAVQVRQSAAVEVHKAHAAGR